MNNKNNKVIKTNFFWTSTASFCWSLFLFFASFQNNFNNMELTNNYYEKLILKKKEFFGINKYYYSELKKKNVNLTFF
jgi:hypothetical protein